MVFLPAHGGWTADKSLFFSRGLNTEPWSTPVRDFFALDTHATKRAAPLSNQPTPTTKNHDFSQQHASRSQKKLEDDSKTEIVQPEVK